MKRNAVNVVRCAGAGLAALATALLVFYVGTSDPLSNDEIQRTLAQIDAQPHNPGGRHNLPALRRFLEDDDGRPFYTVNLYAFNQEARYADDRKPAVTGREAYDRFSDVMIGLLAARGSHPVFGSDWTDSDTWDRIVIVRYRSRRDIADLFASSEFAEASADKWAALERNDRMLVQAVNIPELYVPAILLAVVGASLIAVGRNSEPRESARRRA